MTPGDFPEFFNTHLLQYKVKMPKHVHPSYCILGKREWRYWRQWLISPADPLAVHSAVSWTNTNPLFEGIELLRVNEESKIQFVE